MRAGGRDGRVDRVLRVKLVVGDGHLLVRTDRRAEIDRRDADGRRRRCGGRRCRCGRRRCRRRRRCASLRSCRRRRSRSRRRGRPRSRGNRLRTGFMDAPPLLGTGFRAGRNFQHLAGLDQIGIRNLVAIGVEDFVPAIRVPVELLGDLGERSRPWRPYRSALAQRVRSMSRRTGRCRSPLSARVGAVDETPLWTLEKSGFFASPMSALLSVAGP